MKKILKQCAGIDCSKDQLDVCFGQLTDELEVVHKATSLFPNNRKGFKQLLAWSRKLRDASTGNSFVVEATGVYHESLACYMVDAKQHISIVLPNKARNFAKTLQVRTVTDKVAAKMLCTMGLEKKLDLWQKPDPVFVHLKHLTRERERLQKECTVSGNQIHAEQYSAYASQAVIKRGKKRVVFLENQVQEIETEIKQVVSAHPVLQQRIDKLITIHGVGFLTTVTVVAETNGFHLVHSGKQLASYAGYDVVEKQSGTSVRGKARISKKGNAHLRRAMHFPALVAAKDNQHLNKFYTRIEAKHPDIKMKGYTAVQRKLLLLIYALWKKDEVFVSDYESKRTNIAKNNQSTFCTKEEKQSRTCGKEKQIISLDPVVAVLECKAKRVKTTTGIKKLGQPIDTALNELVLDRSLT